MSCDPHKALATLAGAGSIAADAFGSPEAAATALMTLSELGRSLPVPAGQDRLVDIQVGALFRQIQQAGGRPPTHSADGLPKKAARPGYALVARTLAALKSGDALPEEARNLLDAATRQRQIAGVQQETTGRYRCRPCGQYASAQGGHICRVTATPESLSRSLMRKLRVSDRAFPAAQLAPLLEQARAGSLTLTHRATGEQVAVTLDGLPLALQGGFQPASWADEPLIQAITPNGRVVQVFDATGLRPTPMPTSAVDAAAQESGVAIQPEDRVIPAPADAPAEDRATPWDDSASSLLRAALRNEIVRPEDEADLRLIAEAIEVLAGVGGGAVRAPSIAGAVTFRSLAGLRERVAERDPSLDASARYAQQVADLLDSGCAPLILRAERGDLLTPDEVQAIYAYAGIAGTVERDALAQEARNSWARRLKIVPGACRPEETVARDGKQWRFTTWEGTALGPYRTRTEAEGEAERHYREALDANDQERRASRRLDRLPTAWVDDAGGTTYERCPTCGQFMADGDHACPPRAVAVQKADVADASVSAPMTDRFTSTNLPDIAAYARFRHAATDTAQEAQAARAVLETEMQKLKSFSPGSELGQRRGEVARQLLESQHASIQRGVTLLRQRQALQATYPNPDIGALTREEELAQAWLSRSLLFIGEDGAHLPPHGLSYDTFVEWTRPTTADAIIAAYPSSPTLGYPHPAALDHLPPEAVAAVVHAHRERMASSSVATKITKSLWESYAVRRPEDPDPRSSGWLRTAKDYRVVLEHALSTHGPDALSADQHAWLDTQRAVEPQCLLCMQFVGVSGVHACPVRSGVDSPDLVRQRQARAALAYSCYTPQATRDALRDPDTTAAQANALIAATVQANPLPEVPRVGGTSGTLVPQTITLAMSDGSRPEVQAVACNGLALHTEGKGWRVTHIASGMHVSSQLKSKDAAQVMMQQLLVKTEVDWTHPEPLAQMIAEGKSTFDASTLVEQSKTHGAFGGQRASFPLPSNPTPPALAPNSTLRTGDEFRVGERRWKMTKTTRDGWGIAYCHTATGFVVVNTQTGTLHTALAGPGTEDVLFFTPAAAQRGLDRLSQGLEV